MLSFKKQPNHPLVMAKSLKLLDLIEELSTYRPGVPQFLFSEAIHAQTMTAVREQILTYKHNYPDSNEEIDFIIHSPGGSPSDAYRIIRTLRNNFKKVNIIVPFWAKSAATLLSLGANEIIMDEFGEFGPLDIQIVVEKDDSPEMDRESALNDEYSVRRIEARSQELYYQMFTNLYSSDTIKINKIELSKQLLEYLASFYKPLLSQINPYHLGKKKRMLDIGEQYAQRILTTYHPDLPDRNKDFLIDYLVNRCPDHGYVIDYNLISLFLPNIVKKSSTFGPDYEEVLSDIATELMENGEFLFIGFVLKEDLEEEIQHVEEEIQELVVELNTEETPQTDSKSTEEEIHIPKKINIKTENPKQNGKANSKH